MALGIIDLRAPKKVGGWPEDLKTSFVEVALDGTYAAGGYTLTAANYGLSTILGVIVLGYNGAGAGVLPVWDKAAGKLKLYKGAASTTVTTGSGGFSELATNDTYVSSSALVDLLIIGT